MKRSTLFTFGHLRFEPDRYVVVLRPLDAEDGGGWLATMPDLPGCTGDGETEIEAIADVRSAALEWADMALADGQSIPFPSHTQPLAAE